VNGDEIDDAIDAAVRGIMRTQAPAGLRARVMRRLEAPEPGRPWPMPWMAATVMLALGVALAVLVVRGRAPIAAPAGTAVAVSTPAATPAPMPESPSSAPAGRVAVVENRPLETRRSLAPSAVPPVDDRRVSAMSIDDGGLGPVMAQLAPLTPVGPAALALPASQTRIGEIAVRPLEMDPIRIDPLSSTPR
jgi:hypothetical protein